ncbi:MAG: hypothetical protein XD78_0569 [Desulfotomaculum sp. 46_296]|nr:MAG: hypothetical protein XD78_0569 [Desulfotomaculum sp. 46_296]
MRLLTKSEVKRLEPNVNAASALFVPSTGIINIHEFNKKASDFFTGSGPFLSWFKKANKGLPDWKSFSVLKKKGNLLG